MPGQQTADLFVLLSSVDWRHPFTASGRYLGLLLTLYVVGSLPNGQAGVGFSGCFWWPALQWRAESSSWTAKQTLRSSSKLNRTALQRNQSARAAERLYVTSIRRAAPHRLHPQSWILVPNKAPRQTSSSFPFTSPSSASLSHIHYHHNRLHRNLQLTTRPLA